MKATKEELVKAARIWNQGHYLVTVGMASEDFVLYVRGTDPLNEERESYQEGVVRMFKKHFEDFTNITVERGYPVIVA